jgi:hypothetical protein
MWIIALSASLTCSIISSAKVVGVLRHQNDLTGLFLLAIGITDKRFLTSGKYQPDYRIGISDSF